jgi:hypothetical protein
VTGRERERHRTIYLRADLLARSGVHAAHDSVINALVLEGYPEAPDLLNTLVILRDLQRLCDATKPNLNSQVVRSINKG